MSISNISNVFYPFSVSLCSVLPLPVPINVPHPFFTFIVSVPYSLFPSLELLHLSSTMVMFYFQFYAFTLSYRLISEDLELGYTDNVDHVRFVFLCLGNLSQYSGFYVYPLHKAQNNLIKFQ